MSRSFIISGGIILVLIMVGVWVYLLFFGTPTAVDDMFANFSSTGSENVPRDPGPTNRVLQPETTVDVSTRLSQLTTRPVAGFVFVDDTTARYAERGVGHVYEIHLETGLEERVLNKTFTAVTHAVFAPTGNTVVLVAHDGYSATAYLEVITDDDQLIAPQEFPTDATNIEFASDRIIRYTRVTDTGTVGYSYDLVSGEVVTLFTVPFKDARVLWTDDISYVFNKPAPFHKGGLYAIENGALRRIGTNEYGLSALVHPYDNTYLVTYADPRSDILATDAYVGDSRHSIPLTVLPEKCVFDPFDAEMLWCGGPIESTSRTYQTDWYKGTHTSNDKLWLVETDVRTATLLVNLSEETERVIDVAEITIDPTGSRLLFTNKLDGSLWHYLLPFEELVGSPTTPESTEETSN